MDFNQRWVCGRCKTVNNKIKNTVCSNADCKSPQKMSYTVINNGILRAMPNTWLMRVADGKRKDEVVPMVRTVVLKEGSDELKEVAERIDIESMPSIKIRQVERVENFELFARYSTEVLVTMMKRNKAAGEVVKTLYHGASVWSCDNIAKTGFLPCFIGTAATASDKDKKVLLSLGHAFYFAKTFDVACADRYASADSSGLRSVIECDVVVGHVCDGNPDLKQPQEDLLGVRYDSVVDSCATPNSATMHAVFNPSKIYPKYLIKFTRS